MPRNLTIEQVEAANLHPDDGRTPHVPFGFNNAKWVRFKSQIQPGDEIQEFCTDAKSWQHLAGRAGYALLREGKVIDEFVIIMN